MKTSDLPDVQAEKPEVEIGLNKVGIDGVKKLVEVEGKNRPIVLVGEFSAFVDLPAGRKGVDMSRNIEATNEVLDEMTKNKVESIEKLCRHISEELLDRHSYTTRTEVKMEADYVYKEKTPESNKDTQGSAKVYAGGVAGRQSKEYIGVEVTGVTACPCSQSMMEEEARQKLKKLDVNEDSIKEFLEDIPQPAHSQRSNSFISIKTEKVSVDIEDLIEIARSSMSSKIYNLAKREDEHFMTKEMHKNPKFVEDSVRDMAKIAVKKLDLPDDALVTLKQRNEESIHQHDVYSEVVKEFGQIRNMVSKK